MESIEKNLGELLKIAVNDRNNFRCINQDSYIVREIVSEVKKDYEKDKPEGRDPSTFNVNMNGTDKNLSDMLKNMFHSNTKTDDPKASNMESNNTN